jgi:hypothetical protein
MNAHQRRLERRKWQWFITVSLPNLASAATRAGESLNALTLSMQRLAETFCTLAASDLLRVITPGAWPDQFTLLNRYLRTGVKPEYLFND